jgi:hypothetical protein
MLSSASASWSDLVSSSGNLGTPRLMHLIPLNGILRSGEVFANVDIPFRIPSGPWGRSGAVGRFNITNSAARLVVLRSIALQL